MKTRTHWNVNSSKIAEKTCNPIRSLFEVLKLEPNPEKQMIALSLGDPTVFGNLNPSDEAREAIIDSVNSMKFNGYAPSTGYEIARKAVAEYASTPEAELSPRDVILTSGCSHALDLCITVIANPGQNILVPRPGFPLYRTLAEGLGIETKHYNLLPERGWEIDLDDLESQIDSQTVAIIINNPSNPCGSVFSRFHLQEILKVAERNFIPIIADEIYDYFVFPGFEFIPIASLSTNVPILTCGGLTKRHLVPGWRMGWILIHDRNDVFEASIRNGLLSLSQRIIGSNTIVQGALPAILNNTPQSFFDETIEIVNSNAKFAHSYLSKIPGLHPITPAGAMYMMVYIEMSCFPDIKHDTHFMEALISEQSVSCLPGSCFDFPDYIRIVLTLPEEQLKEACERIEQFCYNHYAVPKTNDRPTDLFLQQMITMPV
ncbi:tyrosine aminotransferase-like [Centruroides vittatus]|uniref:tyrosine aminotransferase-like n=1 Tax=Centruroides vittatus TaxID=120091 RepID=UPI00350FE47E